jgi:hypothetical protein
MTYQYSRRAACRSLFADFQPEYSRSKTPDKLRTIRDLAADGLYSHEIAEKLGTTPKAIQKIFRAYGFPSLQNFHPPREHERVGWKGGVKEVKGYLYKRSPGHPQASKHGNYVAVHRLVLEAKLGRYLLPTEVVDHIDGDPKNNHPDNLRAFSSNAEHLRETLTGKFPDWSSEGLESLDRARRQPRRTWKGYDILPIPVESKTDAGQ